MPRTNNWHTLTIRTDDGELFEDCIRAESARDARAIALLNWGQYVTISTRSVSSIHALDSDTVEIIDAINAIAS